MFKKYKNLSREICSVSDTISSCKEHQQCISKYPRESKPFTASHLNPEKNFASTLKLIWFSLGLWYSQRTIYKTLNGIRRFPAGQLPPGQLPPMKFPPGQLTPGLFPPGRLLLNNSPLDNSPQITAPYESPPRTITPGSLTPENYRWIVSPWTITSQTIPPPIKFGQGNCHLDFWPPRHFSLNNFPLDN